MNNSIAAAEEKSIMQIPTERLFDVVGFGTNAVDHLIRLPHFPEFGSKLEIQDYEVMAGGEIASTMSGLSRLGLRTAYAGKFGDDAAGDLGMRSLRDEGVDVSHCQTVRAQTQIGVILIDRATGERTVLWQRDGRLRYAPSEAPIDLAGAGKVLHMTPHDTGACIAMAEAAREAGTIVSLDVDNHFDGVEDLLRLTDICITSTEFGPAHLGINDSRAALAEISSRYGCSIVGMTLGDQGSLTLSGGEYYQISSVPVPGGCVDTTGAGDAYRVGFLYGLITHDDVARAAELGNLVAALKCRRPGARSGLPYLDEMPKA